MENLKIPYRFFSKLNSVAQESNLVSLGYGPSILPLDYPAVKFNFIAC